MSGDLVAGVLAAYVVAGLAFALGILARFVARLVERAAGALLRRRS